MVTVPFIWMHFTCEALAAWYKSILMHTSLFTNGPPLEFQLRLQ
jgi:hypothetical protein